MPAVAGATLAAMADGARFVDKVLVPVSVALLALGLLFGFASLRRLIGGGGRLVGHPAPDFALDIVYNGDKGDKVKLSLLRGHPVIVEFWATWCGPCQLEAPALDRLARRHREQGLVVVGVNTSDEPGRAATFAERRQLSYPIVYDDRGVAGTYDVDSLPTLVVIDRNGNVVAVRTGAEDDSELDRLVSQAL